MNDQKTGIYLMVQFDWPQPFKKEYGDMAKKLHDVVQGKDWIKETVAASGGIGGEQSSWWVFWLPDYATLDRLFKNREDEVSQAYRDFFSAMTNVRDQVRDEVYFL